MIRPLEAPECGRLFREYFGMELQSFHDIRLLIAFGCLGINIVKFGDWLDKEFPDEANVDDVSYCDIVRQHFGEKAEQLIRRLI